MKHLFLVLIIIGLGILSQAQTEYTITRDGNEKILKGHIDRSMLEKDTSFRWFQTGRAGYSPNSETVSVLRAKGSQLQFVIFGGTWCEDTQSLLPKFLAMLDAGMVPGEQVSIIMVDRQKKSLDRLPEDMQLKSTPTLIILKYGKEVGRIVEYGRNGQWEQELGDILRTKV
jgi:hypothetical protein